MKRVTAFLLFAGVCLTQACNNANNNKNTTDSAGTAYGTDTTMTHNDSMSTASSGGVTSTAPLGKDDSEFAVKAATGGMMEVQLGQIAQGKAMNQRVKDFGNMMVQDHSAADDDLKKLSSAKNLTLPATLTDKQQREINDLNKKNGADFDKAYMKMMVDDHEKDIKEFEKAGKDAKDADLKNFVMKTLPTLQKHLDSAKAITGKK
jgi:putative membrane protein